MERIFVTHLCVRYCKPLLLLNLIQLPTLFMFNVYIIELKHFFCIIMPKPNFNKCEFVFTIYIKGDFPTMLIGLK